ncbi:hypothetical protein [Saccharicrinis carchari]|nr:hypothetical protein [Saccharicrinis carchari]
MNNPFMFTDPSGEFWQILAAAAGWWLLNTTATAVNNDMNWFEAAKQTPVVFSSNVSLPQKSNKNINIDNYKPIAMPNFEKFDYELYPYDIDFRLPPGGGGGGYGGVGAGGLTGMSGSGMSGSGMNSNVNLSPSRLSYMNELGGQSLSPMNSSSYIGRINDMVGGAAAGITRYKGSFRLSKGGKFSFHYYKSNWTGGSRARIVTRNAMRVGKTIGKYSGLATGVIGFIDVRNGYIKDNNRMGYNAYRAMTTSISGAAFAYAGGELGAAAGFYLGVYGAIPGGVIGAAGGGWLGSRVGGWIFDNGYDLLDEEYNIGWK